ncbi:hypothetical protein ACHAXT_004880 [Thalassiosira profunda]
MSGQRGLFLQRLIAAAAAFRVTTDDSIDPSPAPEVEHPHCRLFLAESTIPNAGLGIFTGIDLGPGEAVAEPDIIVPFQDAAWHVSPDIDFHFLWEDYSWDPSEVGMEFDMADGHALVIGTGCMPNCNMALINAFEGNPDYDHAGLHRSKDPGVTGFTGWYNQRMITSREIPAGGEIFVNYGEHWFENREEFDFVPFQKNFQRVDKLLRKLKKLSLKISMRADAGPDFTRDLWDLVSLQGHLFSDTKNSNALPLSFEDMQYAQTAGSAESRLPYSVRSIEWLNENARCMDNIRPGNSTIEQAGRGAFASRFIPEGGLVAPGPLLHIPNRTALMMYAEGEDGYRDPDQPVALQLITNYCFGHRESTVILCPYTSPSAYINHNKSPNAKIVWAKEGTPNHNSFWLEEDVDFLKKTGVIGLSIDYVATRDIQPGDEVFIDYGPDWEEAWDSHIQHWSPPDGSENFETAATLQNDLVTPLRTEAEHQSEPYQPNLMFLCHYGYGGPDASPAGSYEWEDEWQMLHVIPCRITEREYNEADKQYYYTVKMLDLSELELEFGVAGSAEDGVYIPPGEQHILTVVPRWAIQIRDKPYTKDEFLPHPFRHEMMVPDDIFPEAWKNLQ